MRDKKADRKKLLQDAIRVDILEAAESILLENGMEALTMDRIAERAGVAKGTLYLHFKNKDEVLSAAQEACFNPLIQDLHCVFESDLSPREKLERHSLLTMSFFEERINFFRIMVANRFFTPKDQSHFEENSLYWDFFKKIEQVIKDGIRLEIFRPVNTAKAAGIFLEIGSALLIQRIYSKSSSSPEDDADLHIDIFLNGIAA